LSLALRSQLQELLGKPARAEGPRLVSLLVEDVNECGLGLCGEAADCFNGVGTYLCRCKEGYEDRSPTKSGTLCVPVPRSGTRGKCLHASEVLVGAATSLGLVLLVAALVLCRATRQRRSRRNPFLEELVAPEEPVAEVVMELSRLEDCLRLEPFQLKVRAQPPEWI
ncbi:MUP4 protein, partial [Crypturellus soui]|nr:MUP4 protein [Crypturellus soui]